LAPSARTADDHRLEGLANAQQLAIDRCGRTGGDDDALTLAGVENPGWEKRFSSGGGRCPSAARARRRNDAPRRRHQCARIGYRQLVRNALVSDFDGTITQRDVYSLIAERCMPQPPADYFARYRQHRLTHFEAMAAYFAHAPTDEAAFDELLEATEPDPALSNAVRRLQAASWDLIIVSAGSTFYIDRVLGRAGVRAIVHANPGRLERGRGLVLEPPQSSPFFSADVGIDKAAVVRDACARYEQVAFAGDGPPDVPAALIVPPGLRFARGFLAEELRRRNEGFRPYTRWSDIAEVLA
jgi:2-hydroxy-3-keto-5-methylthiopentenyl-1-phosphate phosphatase